MARQQSLSAAEVKDLAAKTAKRKPRGPEAQVLHDCLELLRLRGVFHWRNNTGAVTVGDGKRFVRFGVPGAPDVIAVIHGLAIFVETKTPGKKQTLDQRHFEMNAVKAGAKYWLVRSSAELDAKLTALMEAI